jgi:hypothetical protein
MVEIAKALTRGARVIAFDEPTSSGTPAASAREPPGHVITSRKRAGWHVQPAGPDRDINSAQISSSNARHGTDRVMHRGSNLRELRRSRSQLGRVTQRRMPDAGWRPPGIGERSRPSRTMRSPRSGRPGAVRPRVSVVITFQADATSRHRMHARAAVSSAAPSCKATSGIQLRSQAALSPGHDAVVWPSVPPAATPV